MNQMNQTDRVLGMDWSGARHAGDGVYVPDASHHTGAPSLAIRTGRGFAQNVILLEQDTSLTLVRTGQAMLARQNNLRMLPGGTTNDTRVMHANPAFGCEMYGCPPTCQYAGPAGGGTQRRPGRSRLRTNQALNMTGGENPSEDTEDTEGTEGTEGTGETSDKTIDKYLWAFWGDSPSLAVSIMGPRKDAGALVRRIVDSALKDGVSLDQGTVAERAARALRKGPGWMDPGW